QLYRYVSETLALSPAPELYLRPEQPPGLAIVNAQEKGVVAPGLVIAGPIVDRAKDRELVYELTRRLVLVKPERYLRYALGGADHLASAVQAALVVTNLAPGLTDPEVLKLADHIKKSVPAPVVTQLEVLCTQLLDALGEDTMDLVHWVLATDQT